MSQLYTPATFGAFRLANRVVMAPMTRNRAGAREVPGELMVEHYRQRAGAGMIITEGTHPSARSQSYPGEPGIHSAEQAAGWSRVAGAVHAAGGTVVMQLMHSGRISHPRNNGGREIVAPSAIAAPGRIYTATGPAGSAVPWANFPVPRELTAREMPEVVAEFASAARNAVAAGLDGVEIHGANGYLLHQFLAPNSNVRQDAYGGSPQGRSRLPREVVQAVAEELGASRVGLRISPGHHISGIEETDPQDLMSTYAPLVRLCSDLGLAYLHILGDPRDGLVRQLCALFSGPVILNSGTLAITSRQEAERLVDEGLADAVAVGRPFIANPDLVERWRLGAPENRLDEETTYGGGARGYTDYPTLAASDL